MKVRDSGVLEWVRGQRKMSQVLGAFGLLNFTTLGPFSLDAREPYISLIFHFLSRGKRRITETADSESVDTGAGLYFSLFEILNCLFVTKYHSHIHFNQNNLAHFLI
jgi:hypothetical protein